MHPCLAKSAKAATPLHAVEAHDLKAFLARLSKADAAWLKSGGFAAKAGELALVPGADGTLAMAVFGLGKGEDPLALAACAEKLPQGTYALALIPKAIGSTHAALGWLLGTYEFNRYRKARPRSVPRLVLPAGVDGAEVTRIAEGVFLGRDLIATPANDMGPEELAAAARKLAKTHQAKISITTGEALLKQDFPMIHAVGRASPRAPRLIDMVWGRANAPKLTLVGKGVCFDSGGLDLKSASGMLTMKKDMGGAATVLAIAHMIMDAKLDLRLRVLIPAVENSVSGTAYRPGDILKSRKGLTVEIGNTDAEGRLVLADALALADSEKPDLLIDIATLTGAARGATGMELPPFFTDDEELAAATARHGMAAHDPMWRLPLWRGYDAAVDSPIADITNTPNYNLAGAITAALFLKRFVTESPRWMHLDIPGWNDRTRPGRKTGPEVNTARALYAMLAERYAKKPKKKKTKA
jgi:leucyl aminopeptidase